MKKVLVLVLAAIMALSVTGAYASSSEGSTIVYGVTSSMSGDMGFNQWSSLGGDKPVIYLAEGMAPTCFTQDALWVWDPTIVASHDQVTNEDGTLTFTVTLNDGLKFSDGSAITAKNYVAYPLLFSSPAAVAAKAYGTVGKEFVGQQAYKNGESKVFAGLRLVNDLTFSITVSANYNPYYYGLALLNIFPIDYTMWLGGDSWNVADDGEGCYFAGEGEMNADTISAGRYIYQGRVCSGPFYIESWDVAANEATLKNNPYYPGNFEGQKASIDTIVVKLVDSATMLDQLQTGGVDIIDGIGEGYMINACLDLAETDQYDANVYKYSGYMKLFYQCDWGATQYEAVRQAITYLTDRESLCQETTLGFGNVTNGQYSMAQWMAQDLEEELSSELNAYAYNPDKAVELLKADGWVYNADGSDYVDGSGEIRYKKVPEQEAMKGSAQMPGIVELNGELLMPLVLEYAGHQAGEGIETMLDESLTINLLEADATKQAGMKINKTVMSDAELLSYLNRRGANGEEKYTQPSYNMLSLASGLGSAKFDKSGTWTFDENNIANNKNRYFNHTLDDLSMKMIYGVEAGDDATFEQVWFDYQKEYNAHLPETPLYNWTYCAVFNSKLTGFEETNIWSFQYAILYATVK